MKSVMRIDYIFWKEGPLLPRPSTPGSTVHQSDVNQCDIN
jgi:hypothetical protein